MSGRELAMMKATGYIPRSASHVAVVSLPTGQRMAGKAGTRAGRQLAHAIGQLSPESHQLALPGGR